ncbi:MAG: DNA polymerase III subunit delta' C-terminal domain-containing protein [Planctomycetaceae bacterium]|nr:hypothetical protein [Planctomycetaceae bacterium]
MIDLDQIVAQEQAVADLRQAMAAERLPHGLIFAGPEGVGRQTTATALAKVLLCEEKGTCLSACNACPSCRMMNAGAHPDFNLVYKELAAFHEDVQVRNRVMQELGIDVIDSFLIEPAMRASARGRGKVFVVLEAELMSQDAQNSLLKTLEEPPPGVTIILISSQTEQLLPTTLSRCRLIRFNLLPHDFVTQRLVESGIEADEARFWSAVTGGSLGRSIAMSAQGLYGVKRDILDRLAALGPGGDVELGEELTAIVDKLANATVSASKRADGSTMSKNLAVRQATGAMLEITASVYQDALALSAGSDRPLINADQAQAVRAIAQRFSGDQLCRIIEHFAQFEELLWRNVNHKTVWDNVVITCASAAPLRV